MRVIILGSLLWIGYQAKLQLESQPINPEIKEYTNRLMENMIFIRNKSTGLCFAIALS